MVSVSHVYKAFPANMSCNAIAQELCSRICEPLLSSWMTGCCHCCNHFACKICNANRLADTVISQPSLIQGNGACGSARHLDSREHRENEWKEVLRITDFFSVSVSMSLVTEPTVYEEKWLNIYDKTIGFKIAHDWSRTKNTHTVSVFYTPYGAIMQS